MSRILVEHCLGNFSLEKETDTDRFMLTNKGGYFYFNPASKYRGLYFPERISQNNWSLFKTIDEIRLECKDKTILNKFCSLERMTDRGLIRYYFSNDSLVIETTCKGEITFTLDMREIYDFSDEGRIYFIREEKGCIIAEYKKFTNNILESLSYTKYLAIKTDIAYFEPIQQWKEAVYNEDEARKSYPWNLYVFDAFKLKANRKSRTVVCFSEDKEDAIQKAKEAFESAKPYDYGQVNINSTIEKVVAYNCALKSIDDLYVDYDNYQGFYAGLPWFFQFWTRDEAISLKSVMSAKKLGIAKKILMNRIGCMDEKGRIPNRFPDSKLATADGTGWVFKRIMDLLLILEQKKNEEELFSKDELLFIRGQVKKSIKLHIASFTDNLLIRNGANETWMDTSFENDTREGFRIEIQALWLSMLKLANYLDAVLGEEKDYEMLESDAREKVKNTFFDGNILMDGKGDATIRPNIFLAYYIYPELLFNEEWEKAFDNSISKLWLDWGGMSTIDKSSRLFCANYTGEDNKSYHRGDSWFFLNNIAAICMITLNKEKYRTYIEKIISAGTKDILCNGIIGRSSELSSASVQKAEGSLFQLWSAATYVELIELTK